MRMPSSLFRLWRIRYSGSQGIVASAFLVIVLLGAPAAGAQTFDEASAAYMRGDYIVAFESFLSLAEQGHARSQYNLDYMYHKGLGVRQDDVEAVRWLRRAAEQGHPTAQYSLGVMYHEGQGVPKDDGEAMRWYRRAAEQGHARAQSNLGAAYGKGEGVLQDDAEAMRWYRQAAEQGNAISSVQSRGYVPTGPRCAARLQRGVALVAPGGRER